MKAIICAAGIGERLGLGIPKALVQVGGRPIIDWQLEALKDYEVTVVAGFKAMEIIKHVGGRARVIVSEDYLYTSTCHSIGLVGEMDAQLIVDGDLLFLRKSFPTSEFIGVCEPRSEEPVYAVVEDGLVNGFSLKPTSAEWACIFVGRPSTFLGKRTGYVYEALAPRLPLPAEHIDCFEVDTPGDLKKAERWIAERA